MKIRFLILSLFASTCAYADDIKQLAPTVVTATRVETNSFDLPVSIDVVEQKDLEGQLGMTLSESLIRVPGITAQNRNQMAQDPQISSRGFGARSAFGVRGVRVLVDSIPLTMPDGIGQPGSVDLDSMKSIEVMRGPFSSLYGSSSGGIINMISKDPSKSPEISGGILFGSFNTRKESMSTSGSVQGVNYLIDASNFSTDGYRNHSSTDKNQATIKISTKINEATNLTILNNWFDQRSQDPAGLNAADYASDRKAVAKSIDTTNARVIRNNIQSGFNLEHKLNENNNFNVMFYVGHRYNSQFLPTTLNKITETTGKDSLYQRSYWGNDLRWTNNGSFFDKKYSFTTGVAFGSMSDARLEISATNGTINDRNTASNIKRNEANIGYNFDQYLQGQIALMEKLDFHAGMRHSLVNLRVDDYLYTTRGGTGDSSGAVSYEKTTPVIGLVWKQNPSLSIYANYGVGFETPTFIELAYDNASTGGSSNLALKPSESENFELGFKSFINANTKFNAAIYKINAYQEIVAATTGTYSVYTNVGKTNRQGFEASIDSTLDHNIGLYGSYNYIDAEFKSAFDYQDSLPTINSQLPADPVTNPVTTYHVTSGMKIPGVYKQQIYGEISWKYPELGFKTAFEARHNDSLFVNNANTAKAPGYTIFNLRAGFEQNVQKWKVSEFVRIENLTDRNYVGSNRINDGKLFFYEAGAERNYLLGVNASYHF